MYQQKYDEKIWNNLNYLIYISYIALLTFIIVTHWNNYSDETLLDYKGNIPNRYKRIVVYSCLIGNYDNVSTFKRQRGYDYILFTDQKIVNTNWTVRPIPEEVLKLNVSDVKKQRYVKIHPHKFFRNYDLSLYIDANYIIKGDLDDFIINTMNSIDNIYITHLQFGTDLSKGIDTAKKNKLDNSILLDEIRKRYNDLKIIKKRGIVNAGLILRKHHNPDCIKLMEKWWEEVEKYSHVDNLAFNYASYMTGVKFLYVSYQFTLDYFDHSNHLKKIDY
jgi:hypothetical protein